MRTDVSVIPLFYEVRDALGNLPQAPYFYMLSASVLHYRLLTEIKRYIMCVVIEVWEIQRKLCRTRF